LLWDFCAETEVVLLQSQAHTVHL